MALESRCGGGSVIGLNIKNRPLLSRV
jgi:hypothetical protein